MNFLKSIGPSLEEQGKVKEQGRTMQEQERRIREQGTIIAQLQKEMETVVAHVKEQDSKIQKVSDRIE
jgi:hypothetical protein